MDCIWKKSLKNFRVLFDSTHHDVAVVTFDEHKKMKAVPIGLVDKTKEFNGQITMVHFQATSSTKFEASSAKPIVVVTGDKVSLRSYVQTKNGDCGTPVFREGHAYGIHQRTHGVNNGNSQIAFTEKLLDLILESLKPQQKN